MKQDFKTKKSLGQHILTDQNIILKIINHAPPVLKETNVIEVGPGTGALTKALLPNVKFLLSIEKDTRTNKFLSDLKDQFKNFAFFFADALNTDLVNLYDSLVSDLNNTNSTKLALISNLPYNIGTILFTRWLKQSHKFEYFLLMFQKEVALRITSKQGSKHYSRLSLYTKLFGNATFLFDVSKYCFNPVPKVDSAMILFKPYKTPLDINKNVFEFLIKAAFSQKRKMLRNSLKNLEVNPSIFNVYKDKRPEELSFEDFILLSKNVNLDPQNI